jgi:hypothetical protein
VQTHQRSGKKILCEYFEAVVVGQGGMQGLILNVESCDVIFVPACHVSSPDVETGHEVLYLRDKSDIT